MSGNPAQAVSVATPSDRRRGRQDSCFFITPTQTIQSLAAPIEKEKLQRLAWGPAAPNGLHRLLFSSRQAYADGEEVVRRLVFHNSGRNRSCSPWEFF